MEQNELLIILMRIESIADFAYINDNLLQKLQSYLHIGMSQNQGWIFQVDHQNLSKMINEVVLSDHIPITQS